MREIKFRAWNDRENVIVPFEQIAIQVTGLKIDEGQSQNILMVDFFSSFGKGVVLMQYAGLKDKNGKEIYEGDVLEGGTPYGFQKLEVKIQGCGWYPFVVNMMRTDNCEIIGNIYENPDLISSHV